MFEPIDQAEWSISDAFRSEHQELRNEISIAIDPIELAKEFADEIKIAAKYQSKERAVASYVEKCSDRPDFIRQCFVIVIESQSIFNRLFNSRSGYRAMYLHSPEKGQEYNSYLIELIRIYLVRDRHTEASIHRASAKIWPFFENHMLQDALAVPKWRHSPLGRSVFDPRYPVVVVKGAFLNSEMQEFDPKPDRPERLHRDGYV